MNASLVVDEMQQTGRTCRAMREKLCATVRCSGGKWPFVEAVETGNEPGLYDDAACRSIFEAMARGVCEGNLRMQILPCNTELTSDRYWKGVECQDGERDIPNPRRGASGAGQDRTALSRALARGRNRRSGGGMSTLPPGVTLPEIPIGALRMDGRLPVFILGPCVMESEAFVWEIARALKVLTAETGVPFVFKASYDKANRTSISSYRGMGCREGCALMASVGRELGVPVTTDVHSPEEAEIAGEYMDVLQIPAFLCRQTDLIVAAARTGRVVNVKKGQFLAPWDVKNIAQKLESAGNTKFFFTERGVSFGYNNLVADMRSLYWMREMGYRVCFDATHSVQRPGGLGGTSGGDGVLAPVLARAAVATGCDAVFMETHFDPSKSLSDGPNMVPFDQLGGVLRKLKAVHAAVAE